MYNVESYIAKTLRELERVKIENLLENRYNKLRAIGESSAIVLQQKTEAARERIKAAVQAIPAKSKSLPAKV